MFLRVSHERTAIILGTKREKGIEKRESIMKIKTISPTVINMP
jgi:hypothetical protein